MRKTRKSVQVNIWFERPLWKDAKAATELLNDREHLNLTPSEFVRRALRRECAEVLNQPAEAA